MKFRRCRKALLNQHDKALIFQMIKDIAASMHVGLAWTPADNQHVDFGLDVNREDLEECVFPQVKNLQPYGD